MAWSVHFFTASGVLAAFMALIAVDQKDWRLSFIWLVLCFIIDSLDGTLARKFNVNEVLPSMDGKNIDYVIDFLTYVIIPCYFFYKADMVSDPYMPFCISVMLLSSAIYYGKKEMVVDDQYFIGFPVLWNFAVFFQFFVLENNATINLISIIVLGIAHFIPLKFAYPSRAKKFFWIHLIVSIVGLTAGMIVLFKFPMSIPLAKWLTIFGASYFVVFALFDSVKSRTEYT